jgi:hypothetical protein
MSVLLIMSFLRILDACAIKSLHMLFFFVRNLKCIPVGVFFSGCMTLLEKGAGNIGKGSV